MEVSFIFIDQANFDWNQEATVKNEYLQSLFGAHYKGVDQQ